MAWWFEDLCCPAAQTAHRHPIVADLPGVVVSVQAVADQLVTANDDIALMESMKMLIPVRADRSGRITDVRCRVGDVVRELDVLAQLECCGHEAGDSTSGVAPA